KLWEFSQAQKTPQFKKAYKKRASIEWKNAEIKRFHGLARAKGYGLKSVSIQAKLTAIAVNLKRIAALVAEKAAILFSFRSQSGYFMHLRPYFFLRTNKVRYLPG
ncbi:MAG: hypothetical protein GX996_07700, partial [Firmicutes bacterium]|nr:hypothetical protein [Bacillota bacterium]